MLLLLLLLLLLSLLSLLQIIVTIVINVTIEMVTIIVIEMINILTQDFQSGCWHCQDRCPLSFSPYPSMSRLVKKRKEIKQNNIRRN